MAAVVITGYQQLLRDLDQVQQGLRKETLKDINRAAGTARTLARGFLPEDPGMSGWDKANYKEGSRWWDRAYNAREARMGIQIKRGQSKPDGSGYRNEIGLANKTFGGMIYELAGSKSSGKGNGIGFIENIASTGLHAPLRRVVVRAVIEIGPKVQAAIKHTLAQAELRFNMSQARTWRS